MALDKIQQIAEKAKKIPTAVTTPSTIALSQGVGSTNRGGNEAAIIPDSKHAVLVTSSDLNIAVVAPLPENFAFSIDSDYEAPFNESIIGNNKLGAMASLSGFSGMVQAMSAQVWRGNNSVAISLPLTFMSRTDPLREIRNPILNLCKLVSPQADTPFSLLVPPGPTLNFSNIKEVLTALSAQVPAQVVDVTGNDQTAVFNEINADLKLGIKNRISLDIGNFIRFDSVIIESLSLEFSNVLSPSRYNNFPWRVTAQLTFKTFTAPSIKDWFNIFKVGGG